MPQIASKLEPTFVGPVLDANLLDGQVPVANGGTGVDSLSGLKTNLNLNNVDNTADVNKPVSTAQASAISTALATNLANFNAVLAQTQTARDEALNYGSAIVKYNWYDAEALTGLANNAGVIVLSSDTGTHISVSGDFGAVDGQTPNSGFYQYSTLLGKLVRRSDLESTLIAILKDQIELAATRTEAFASSIATTLDNYVSDSITEGLTDSSIPNNSFFPVVTNDGRHYLVKKINSTTSGTVVEYNTVTAFLAESAIVTAVKNEALQYSNAKVVASWTEAAALTGLANNAAVYVLSVDTGTHTSVAGDYGSVSGQTPNSGYYAYSTSLSALVRKAPLESSLVKGYRDQTKAYFDALGQMFEGYIFTTVASGLADPSVPNNSFFPVISDDNRHYVVYKDGTGAAGQTIEYATAFSGIEAPRVRAAYTALAAMSGWVDGMYGMVTAADTGTHTSASGDVGASGGQTPNRGHYVYSAAQSKLIRVGDLESYISTINKNLTEAYANTVGTMFDGYIYQTTAEGLADPEVPNGTFFPVITADNRRYDVLKVNSTTAGQTIEYPTITYLDNNHTKISDIASTAAGKGSALVGFLPAGTGSVGRTSQDKLRDVVSIKDFGVIGNGVDETIKIQNAVTYAADNDLILIWHQPVDTYVISGLTFPAGKNVVWLGEGRKRVKITGLTTDATIGAPTGTVVDIENFRFENFLSGFVMDGIATGAELRFHNLYLKNCGRMRNIAAARTDFRAFIQSAPTANKIESLEVTRVVADQGDFAVCYRGPFKSVSVRNVNTTNMERTPVWIGWSGDGISAYDREFVEVSNCRMVDTVSSVATEYEIHGIFVNAFCFDIHHNYINNVRDIHASIHDSEAIYVKGPVGRIEFNTVIDGGRGDGMITSKSFNYAGGPINATDSRFGRYVTINDNTVQKTSSYNTLYGATGAAYFCKAGALMVHNNKAYGQFDTFFACYGGGQVCDNRGEGQVSYGVRFFPSYTESGSGVLSTEQVLIERNDFSFSGSLSSAVNVRMSHTTGGQSLGSLVIRGNVARIASGLVWAGENSFWSVRVDRIASGTSNEVRRAVLEDNKAYGASGAAALSCYRFDTAQGTAGVAGKITRVRIKGGESDFSTNIVTHSWGAAGDCSRMEILDEIHENVSNDIFSGTPANITLLRVRGVSGTYKSESRGTITFNSGDTAKTLTTGVRSSMFPATLADANLVLTPASALGSTKAFSATAIDTANRNFTVSADVAPGASVTLNWQFFNPYYYN